MKMKIGVIREGKVPPDSRVPLTPKQCRHIIDNYAVELVVQPSDGRCYTSAEYEAENIPFQEDLSDCDVLMGVKEVPIDMLIPNKKYFFFSHTIKLQPYNQKLLHAILEKEIQLFDYEVLKDDNGKRVIAFGFFAGMVGAHNGLMTYGWRTGKFNLPRMKDMHDYAEAIALYNSMTFPAMKIVLTGSGRVGQGAKKVLEDMGIKEVAPKAFLNEEFDEAVFTVLNCVDYVARKDGSTFHKKDFYTNPKAYESTFEPYTKVADLMINGIYWDNDAPAFFKVEDMLQADWKMNVIADVTCDIAPVSSIPSTIDASTIADPIFGFDPKTGEKAAPHGEGIIDMMTIDNLPNELPRDASEAFGNMFIEHVLNELLAEKSDMMERASVTKNGDLGSHFEYMRAYANGALV